MKKRLIVLLFLITITCGYIWTATGSYPQTISGRQTDYFNLLAHGILKGHLYLDYKVPKELLAADDPYDPARRPDRLVLYDASYFHHHYYIYFGPAPVLTLLIPFFIVTRNDLPISYAVLTFCIVGYLALSSSFLLLRARYYKNATNLTLFCGLLALAGPTFIFALLRRPYLWELPISAGYAFYSLSLLCLVAALQSRRSLFYAILGGTFLGLAVASRASLIFTLIIFVLPLTWPRIRQGVAHAYTGFIACAAIMPFLAITGVLLWYNYVRFGSILEFGEKYQLNAIKDAMVVHFSPSYILYNSYTYFLAPLHLQKYFPFLRWPYAPPQPRGYYGSEYGFGIVTNLPFSWFAVFALTLLPRERNRVNSAGGVRRHFELLLLCSFVAQIGVLLAYFCSSIRYMVDFMPTLMLAASLGASRVEESLPSPSRRRSVFGIIVVIASCLSAAVSWLATVNMFEPAGISWPQRYRLAATALNFPVNTIDFIRGRRYGPISMDVGFNPASSKSDDTIGFIAAGGVKLEEIRALWNDGHLRLSITDSDRHTVLSDPLRIQDSRRHELIVSVNELYPSNTAEAIGIRSQVPEFDYVSHMMIIEFDGKVVLNVPQIPRMNEGTRKFGSFSVERRFDPHSFIREVANLRHVSIGSLRPIRAVGPGFRMSISILGSMLGRSFPILVTGRWGAADILYLHVNADGSCFFGYDDWGRRQSVSPVFKPGADAMHLVDCWPPSLSHGTRSDLIIRIDGRPFWRTPVENYDLEPYEIDFGRDPLDVPAYGSALEDASFDSVNLPYP